MVVVEITYEKYGTAPPVFVAGSFTDWTAVELEYKTREIDGTIHNQFIKQFDLIPGQYQYKFRLGYGDWWTCDESKPMTNDHSGNTNNSLEVTESSQNPEQAAEINNVIVNEAAIAKPEKSSVKHFNLDGPYDSDDEPSSITRRELDTCEENYGEDPILKRAIKSAEEDLPLKESNRNIQEKPQVSEKLEMNSSKEVVNEKTLDDISKGTQITKASKSENDIFTNSSPKKTCHTESPIKKFIGGFDGSFDEKDSPIRAFFRASSPKKSSSPSKNRVQHQRSATEQSFKLDNMPGWYAKDSTDDIVDASSKNNEWKMPEFWSPAFLSSTGSSLYLVAIAISAPILLSWAFFH